MRIVIYGVGKAFEEIYNSIDLEKYEIVCIVDTYNFGQTHYGFKILSLEEFLSATITYDYILICSQYDNAIRTMLTKNSINSDIIVSNGIAFHKNIDKAFEFYKLNLNEITIISNNCYAGMLYNTIRLKYCSPFMWTSIDGTDYIKLLKNLRSYLNDSINIKIYFDTILNYPVGMLKDIKINFVHSKNCDKAYEDFVSRTKRICWDNILVIGNLDDIELIDEFMNLPYNNKFIITDQNYGSNSEDIYIYKGDVLDRYAKFIQDIDIYKYIK